MGPMKVSGIGEFGLIARLAAAVGAGRPAELVVGIGDDAAVWRAGETYLLATTDTLVEGVHFLPRLTPWEDLGWKALAVNVSDVAAMGGRPLFALVTLALSPETDVADVDALYAGLRECAEGVGIAIAGGDIVRAPQVSVTVALIGEAQVRDGRPLLLRRDAARPGDAIAVTGTLGDSAGGLRRLREGAPPTDPLVRAHLQPRPPLAMAQEAARLGITCGIDISDGLLQDLGHICETSGVGVTIRAGAVPISGHLDQAYPDDALALACTGGEDYEMLFSGRGEVFEKLQSATGAPLTIIGEITGGPPRVRLLDATGNNITLDTSGWDHLRRP